MGLPEQRIGQLLGGKYRLDELLALGGMGLVYGARHEATGRAVAIKLLRPELALRPELVQRVSAEARLAVEASHSNVVEVLDAGADAHGIPYLVLERLYGQPLDALLDEPLPLLTVAQALVPVMNALAALHQLGIVHRDIKPSNIFLSVDSSARVTPKLLDFGIAKALEAAGSTLSGGALGTPAYMAPEQALGCRAVGPVTDVWSMGVVFARCLTGHLPFEGVATRGVRTSCYGLRAEDLQGVPEPVALVLASALQFEPRERPPSMAEFRAALLSGLQAVDARQLWPSAASVSYAVHELALAALLPNGFAGTAETTNAGARAARVGARARARGVLTRTLSRYRYTASALRSPLRSVLRWSLTLLAGGATAWALLASAPRGDASAAVGAGAPAPVRSVESLHIAATPLNAEALHAEPALAMSSPNLAPVAREPAGWQPDAPLQLSAPVRGALNSSPPRKEQRVAGTEPRVEAQLPGQSSAAAAATLPKVGANRSPIIKD